MCHLVPFHFFMIPDTMPAIRPVWASSTSPPWRPVSTPFVGPVSIKCFVWPKRPTLPVRFARLALPGAPSCPVSGGTPLLKPSESWQAITESALDESGTNLTTVQYKYQSSPRARRVLVLTEHPRLRYPAPYRSFS